MENLEYIDQATTPSDISNINSKGYQTIDRQSDSTSQTSKQQEINKNDDLFKTPPTNKLKTKLKPKTNGTKKKTKKVKTPTASLDMNNSQTNVNSDKMNKDVDNVPQTPPKEIMTTVKTVTTDTETTKIVTTTTSLNRYTFTRFSNDDDDGEKPERKIRTHSCSSIPYDNIIENLAPFRKRFNNIQLFPDMVDDKKGIVFFII